MERCDDWIFKYVWNTGCRWLIMVLVRLLSLKNNKNFQLLRFKPILVLHAPIDVKPYKLHRGDNTDAQLGVDYAKYGGGDSSGRGYLFKTNVPLPVNVPDNVGWKSVSLNSVSGTKDTACAVKEGGTAWCW